MNTRDLARVSYQLATRLEECPFDNFWVVLLDDGTEVFQSEDDGSLKEPSPWMRLKKLCVESGRKICHMAYASRTNQAHQINAEPSADGYFFAKRARRLMTGDPRLNGYSDDSIGIGYLKGNTLSITWRTTDGRIEKETRAITSKDPITLIRS